MQKIYAKPITYSPYKQSEVIKTIFSKN